MADKSDILAVIKLLDKTEKSKEEDWERRTVPLTNLDDCAKWCRPHRVAVNCWTRERFYWQIKRNTGEIRHIDPVTGQCTGIVHQQRHVAQRSRRRTTKSTPEKGQVRE